MIVILFVDKKNTECNKYIFCLQQNGDDVGRPPNRINLFADLDIFEEGGGDSVHQDFEIPTFTLIPRNLRRRCKLTQVHSDFQQQILQRTKSSSDINKIEEKPNVLQRRTSVL